MRESCVFYNSFYEAIKEIEDVESRVKLYEAILAYALQGEEPQELVGVEKAIFALIKPQINANNKRYEDGKKGADFGKLGGRPKKQITPNTQEGFLEKTPVGLSQKTPNVNVNENANENVNENENVVVEEEKEEATTTTASLSIKKDLNNWYGEYSSVHLTQDQYSKLLVMIASKELLELFISQLDQKIASKKGDAKPYDENYPEMHFIAIKAYWQYFKTHPEKFKSQNANKDHEEYLNDLLEEMKNENS